MAAPKSTTWALEPHTAAKHAILKRYLGAWLPILSQGHFRDIVYIDAFAGPGVYSGGEDGSPIIAIKELASRAGSIKANVHFHFIELEPDRAAMLGQLVAQQPVPQAATVEIHERSFEDAYPHIRPQLSGGAVPTFAFIDAFGWTGFPFGIVQDILSRTSCEVLVNFMYEEINRFIGLPDQAGNFDRLFGCSDWRACIGVADPTERNLALRELYGRQLRTRARYVRTFEMRNQSGTVDYYLFFATNNLTGLSRMKDAMWKVDPLGDFTFSDATDADQKVLFSQPNFRRLEQQIQDRFHGAKVRVEQVGAFVVSETAFRVSHFKPVLKKLESEARLSVDAAKPGRRSGTFPDGTLIRFL